MDQQSGDIRIIKQIDAYLKGQLSEKEVDDLWVELLKNQEYLDYLETELTVKAILGKQKNDSNRVEEPGASKLQKSWKWIAAAASIVILVVAINLLKTETQKTLKEEAIGKINMTTELAAPMVMRSQESGLSGADSLMNIGFEAALSGDVPRAVQVYEDVIKRFDEQPVAARAYLNIGIIRYNAEEYQNATNSFNQALERVEEDDLIKEKAYWYLGNTYLNLDQLQKAREAIYNAYALDGTYRKPAFRLLKKLDYELGNIQAEEIE